MAVIICSCGAELKYGNTSDPRLHFKRHPDHYEVDRRSYLHTSEIKVESD